MIRLPSLRTRTAGQFARLGMGIVLAGMAFTASAQTLNINGFPGTIGAAFRKAFMDTYDKSVNIRYVESWDSARFTQMQANRARPRDDVVMFTDLTLPLVAKRVHHILRAFPKVRHEIRTYSAVRSTAWQARPPKTGDARR